MLVRPPQLERRSVESSASESAAAVIKLSLRLSNQPETVVELGGASATLGRAPDCDVQIPLPHVSKRHVRVLKGVVLIDLGSSNGTFVAGARIAEPTLLEGDEFELGEGEVRVRVLADEPRAPADQPRAGTVGEELERLRARVSECEQELTEAHTVVDRLHAKAERLRLENQRLSNEIAELRGRPESGTSTAQPSR